MSDSVDFLSASWTIDQEGVLETFLDDDLTILITPFGQQWHPLILISGVEDALHEVHLGVFPDLAAAVSAIEARLADWDRAESELIALFDGRDDGFETSPEL